jgi:hypothetical protein
VASDTSLIFNIIARDKASAIFNKVRANAENTGKAIGLALAPAAGPLAAGAAAGIMSVGAAMAGAGAAAKVYGAVYKTAFTEVDDASKAMDKTRDKIEKLGEAAKLAPDAKTRDSILKQQEKASRELKAQLALLPPETRKVVTAYDGLKGAWKGFVNQNKPAIYRQMTTGMGLLQTIIPKLQPLFDVASRAVDRLLARLGKFVKGGGVERLVAFLSGQAGPAFQNFERIGANVFVTIGRIFGAFDSSGPGVLGFLAAASDKMRQWAEGGGAEKLVAYFQDNGPGTAKILLDIAKAAMTIAQAMAPFAPISIAIAGALARLIAAVPPGVITAIVAAFIAFNAALKVYAVWTATAAARTAIATVRQKAWAAAVAAGNWAKATALAAAHSVKMVAVRVATVAATVAQRAWNAVLMAGRWVIATAQAAAYAAKMVAVRVATAVATGAQIAWNAALVAGRWVVATAQMVAYLAKQAAVTIATKAMAAAQIAWNVAMSISPIGLVIAAIVLLVAGIVILWNKSAAFRNFWINAWNGIKTVAGAIWGFIRAKALAFFDWAAGRGRAFVAFWQTVWTGIKTAARVAWDWVSTKIGSVFNNIRSGANKVGSILGSMWNGLKNGFRSAVNLIVRGWNSLSFSIPGFSFAGVNVDGFSIGVRQLPYLAKGGVVQQSGMAVVGEQGPEIVSLTRGAQVTPLTPMTPRAGTRREVLALDLRGEREIVALIRRLIRTANLLEG